MFRVETNEFYSFLFVLGWALHGYILSRHNQELYQSNTHTKRYGIYKIIQHIGEFFF